MKTKFIICLEFIEILQKLVSLIYVFFDFFLIEFNFFIVTFELKILICDQNQYFWYNFLPLFIGTTIFINFLTNPRNLTEKTAHATRLSCEKLSTQFDVENDFRTLFGNTK